MSKLKRLFNKVESIGIRTTILTEEIDTCLFCKEKINKTRYMVYVYTFGEPFNMAQHLNQKTAFANKFYPICTKNHCVLNEIIRKINNGIIYVKDRKTDVTFKLPYYNFEKIYTEIYKKSNKKYPYVIYDDNKWLVDFLDINGQNIPKYKKMTKQEKENKNLLPIKNKAYKENTKKSNTTKTNTVSYQYKSNKVHDSVFPKDYFIELIPQ